MVMATRSQLVVTGLFAALVIGVSCALLGIVLDQAGPRVGL